MLKFLIRKDEKVKINTFLKQEKTAIINNNIILQQRDYIEYTCDKCGSTHNEKFRFNEKFFDEKILCKSCKIKQTNKEKYGHENTFHLPETRKKALKNAWTKETRNKRNKTNIKRYGHENAFQIKDIQEENRDKTMSLVFDSIINNKDIKPLFTKNDYLNKKEKYHIFQWECKNCSHVFEDYYANGIIPSCPNCFPKKSSLSEIEIKNFLHTLNIDYIENTRKIISPYELDIFISKFNLAIEFNGLYWHSDAINSDKKYHLNKTNLFREKGIKLIHIFEDEWLNKKEIVESIISSKLGMSNKIGARKCKTVYLENQVEFLNQNHIQGYINSDVTIGLMHKNSLVSVLTLGKPRFNKNYEWEILRYCNKLNTSIIGGFQKLIKRFIDDYDPKSIITYSDQRYFDGNIYRNSGFKLLKITDPNYWYVKNDKRYSRYKFQKHRLENQLEVFDPNLSESQNMKNNNYKKIYDCGNFVYEMKRD